MFATKAQKPSAAIGLSLMLHSYSDEAPTALHKNSQKGIPTDI
jgi:hypothetical protein